MRSHIAPTPLRSVVRDARASGRTVPDVSVMLAYERLAPPTYPFARAEQRILASGTSVSDATFFVQERGEEIRLGLEYRGSVIGSADAAGCCRDSPTCFDTGLVRLRP